MSTLGIFAGVLLAVIMAYIMFAGFLTPERSKRRELVGDESEKLQTADELRRRLDLILESIHDLDFDFDMGKISDEVYAEQRKMLIGRGVSLLIRLDQVAPQLDQVDQEIEAAVFARRATQRGDSVTGAERVDRAIEAAVRLQRQKV